MVEEEERTKVTVQLQNHYMCITPRKHGFESHLSVAFSLEKVVSGLVLYYFVLLCLSLFLAFDYSCTSLSMEFDVFGCVITPAFSLIMFEFTRLSG